MAMPALWALPRKKAYKKILYSGTDYYVIESILGQGTFGTVAKCRRISDLRPVAIKMIKKEIPNLDDTEEVSVLEEVQQLDPDKCSLVRWYGAFQRTGYTCLEFECLDKSLWDFMEERCFQPLALEVIRPVVKQVTSALHHLKTLNIIHADLKPTNVMLVDQKLQPYRVKVIDFGLAHKLSYACQGVCIQTLPYRAPEVMLAIPYSTAVDVWSLGCITAFLYLGVLLYPGETQYEMLRYIVLTQGQPPDSLLDKGHDTANYFVKDSSSNRWRLKKLKEYFREEACQFKDKRKTVLTSLEDFRWLRPIHPCGLIDKQACRDKLRDIEVFVDLLKGMLHLDAAHRLTPCQLVQHHFITMHHFSMQTRSAPVTSSLERMKVCSQTPRELECCSLKQSFGRAAQPVRESSTGSVDHDLINSHPSIRSQIPRFVHSRITVKHGGASHQGKRAKVVLLSHQRKNNDVQTAGRSSQTGVGSTFRQSARLTSALPVKRKEKRGRIPEMIKNLEPNCQERKSDAAQITYRIQTSMDATQAIKLTSSMRVKRKEGGGRTSSNLKRPEPGRSRLPVLSQPSTSQSLMPPGQRGMNKDCDSHERKANGALSTCPSSQAATRSTYYQVVRLTRNLPVEREEEESQNTHRSLSPAAARGKRRSPERKKTTQLRPPKEVRLVWAPPYGRASNSPQL